MAQATLISSLCALLCGGSHGTFANLSRLCLETNFYQYFLDYILFSEGSTRERVKKHSIVAQGLPSWLAPHVLVCLSFLTPFHGCKLQTCRDSSCHLKQSGCPWNVDYHRFRMPFNQAALVIEFCALDGPTRDIL